MSLRVHVVPGGEDEDRGEGTSHVVSTIVFGGMTLTGSLKDEIMVLMKDELLVERLCI